jgi:hypothetical protein
MQKLFKQIGLISGLILTAAVITLAFIPHYICACGEMGRVQDGSILTKIVHDIAKALFG